MPFGVLMISSQVQGLGPLQSMNTHSAVKVRYSCKSCLRQKVGEAAEYFTNQKQGGCLFNLKKVGLVITNFVIDKSCSVEKLIGVCGDLLGYVLGNSLFANRYVGMHVL
ncbi:hypothetical protein MTR67_020027 [Solanum verrucosum]|uniref:Uncharacterized protein n=1 Tax=Solanum verrucosum TaxID=315347 RepID=A0AAF0QPU1_SOLVR|nr:hypothetical protein MTR67_020027 [Solanum verrucosum]